MDDIEYWKMLVGSLVRHGLTSVAGVLVTMGLVAPGDKSSFVQVGSGIVVGLVGLGWSWWRKSGRAKVQAELDATKAKLAAVKGK
jgi:hypothetical protein